MHNFLSDSKELKDIERGLCPFLLDFVNLGSLKVTLSPFDIYLMSKQCISEDLPYDAKAINMTNFRVKSFNDIYSLLPKDFI